MKKSGVFSIVIFLIIVMFGIVVFSVFNHVPGGEKPLFAPPTVPMPKNCSNSTIQSIWDTIFVESSTGINIVTNTSRQDYCEYYYAWKQVDGLTYVMAGTYDYFYTSKDPTTLNESRVRYVWGNYTNAINATYLALNSSQVRDGWGMQLVDDLIYDDSELFGKNWSMAFTPDGIFSLKYKYRNETAFTQGYDYFEIYNVNDYDLFPGGYNHSFNFHNVMEGGVHRRNQTTYYKWQENILRTCDANWSCTSWGACNGTSQNRTCVDQRNCWQQKTEYQLCSPLCTSNWVPINATPCNASESFVIWYNDTNNCANSTRPANTTGYCDYNRNGLIGRLENVNDINFNLDILEIDGRDVNYSRNYSGEKVVEFIEEENDVEIIRLWFEYDFDDSPLNLYTTKIEKQNDESDFGYLIVEGLSDVSDKDFRVDRVYDSNVLCIRDSSSINSPDDISENCDGTGEYEIYCPGKKNKFNCTDGGDGTYLIIGLDNSGVRELEDGIVTPPPPPPPGNGSCQQSWDCGLWTTCASGQQSRICTDLSTCPNVTKSRNETQTCSSGCTADWECGEWTPADCSEGEEQTQECNDANGCEAAETRTRDCVVEDGGGSVDWTLIAIIIGAAVVVLGAVILIIILKRRKDDKEAEERNSVFPVIRRPAAGTFSPTHYGGYGFGR